MAYSTGISASVSDVVAATIAFAISNGWTAGSTWTSGSYSLKSISKNSVHFVFQYNASELYLNTAKGVTGSGLADAQTNAVAVSCKVFPVQGPHVGYHLFTDGTAIHCVIEVTANSFTHFNFGELTKTGTWAGGQFVTGSCKYVDFTNIGQLSIDTNLCDFPFHTNYIGWNDGISAYQCSHLRTDVFGTNKVHVFGAQIYPNALNTCWSYTWAVNGGRFLIKNGVNTFNGRAVILPMQIISSASDVTEPYYQLGTVPNCGLINTKNISPKDVVNTDWMVFPIGIKGIVSSANINSQDYGLAYKK